MYEINKCSKHIWHIGVLIISFSQILNAPAWFAQSKQLTGFGVKTDGDKITDTKWKDPSVPLSDTLLSSLKEIYQHFIRLSISLQIQEVIQLLEDSQVSSESEQLKEKLSVILQWRIMAIVG